MSEQKQQTPYLVGKRDKVLAFLQSKGYSASGKGGNFMVANIKMEFSIKYTAHGVTKDRPVNVDIRLMYPTGVHLSYSSWSASGFTAYELKEEITPETVLDLCLHAARNI